MNRNNAVFDSTSYYHRRFPVNCQLVFERCQTFFCSCTAVEFFRPPDLVVKFQPVGIVNVILRLVLRPHVVYQREIKG